MNYKAMLDNHELSLSPFSSLPNGVSVFYQDHSEYFSEELNQSNDEETIFHTDYFWFGSRDKSFNVSIKFNKEETAIGSSIQLRVHRYATLASGNIECVYEKDLPIDGITEIEEEFVLAIDEDYCYAVIGKIKTGNCIVKKITIDGKPASKIDRKIKSTIPQEIEI